MKLGKLLQALSQDEIEVGHRTYRYDSYTLLSAPETAQADIEISGIKYASNKVEAGNAFVAVIGFHTDGHKFIPDAVRRGAKLIVGSNRDMLTAFIASEAYDGAAIIWVEDERRALANLAAAFYDYPARELGVIGVTGTDGKTTTTFLISDLLEFAGKSTGLTGTVDLKIGKRRWKNDSRQTTLEAPEIQELLAEMVQAGVDYAVLESSSHGLALHKLLKCFYDVAVLTNVTTEHLDFHGTVEQYRRDKARLFELLFEETAKDWLDFPKTAVINQDDPNAELYIDTMHDASWKLKESYRILTYGLGEQAIVRATDLISTAANNSYTLNYDKQSVRIKINLPGDFNVYNSLAAATVALNLGIDLETIAAGLAQVKGVPGRMQLVDEGQDFTVVVDYAHTPESLSKVLKILRPLTKGKLLVVFGSAGERDRIKRPMQGRVAAAIADFAVFTNEDPRLEDPDQILAEIAAGAQESGWIEGKDYLCIVDRTTAIEEVLRRAKSGDTVLLAGKGHEQCVIIGTEKVPWDEYSVAQTILRKLKNSNKAD
jgi:UDP-N-acetylmuramoyl-L-alanyl-D-glutamate--2,6-diaminopimelate ligase